LDAPRRSALARQGIDVRFGTNVAALARAAGGGITSSSAAHGGASPGEVLGGGDGGSSAGGGIQSPVRTPSSENKSLASALSSGIESDMSTPESLCQQPPVVPDPLGGGGDGG
jgi:hypothetical protein